MNLLYFLSIPLGYLLGSLPSAFIIGKLIGKIDIRSEGDGRISAAVIYRKLGLLPFLLAVALDVGKGIISIHLANIISQGNWVIVMLTGFAVVSGHSWPVFLRFKGGLGATVIWGVLAAIGFLQIIIAFIPGLIFMLKTKKSGTATGIIIISLTLIFLVQKILYIQGIIWRDIPWYFIPYPLFLIIFMVLKHHQIKKTTSADIDFSDS